MTRIKLNQAHNPQGACPHDLMCYHPHFDIFHPYFFQCIYFLHLWSNCVHGFIKKGMVWAGPVDTHYGCSAQSKNRKMFLSIEERIVMSALLWTSPACHLIPLRFPSLIYDIKVFHFVKGLELRKLRRNHTYCVLATAGYKDGQSTISVLEERELFTVACQGQRLANVCPATSAHSCASLIDHASLSPLLPSSSYSQHILSVCLPSTYSLASVVPTWYINWY